MNQFEDILKKLYQNMLLASILYFPKQFFETANLDWTLSTGLNLMDYSNKVLVFEKNGNVYFVEDELPYLEVLKKRLLLDDNILFLLNLKEKQSNESFDFIIEKYLGHLNLFVSISSWLLEHVANDVATLSDNCLSSFKVQHEIFSGHSMDIIRRFPKTLSVYKNATFILKKDDGLSAMKTIMNPERLESVVRNQNLKYKKEDRKSYINELRQNAKTEAEDYLLKHVFNVAIENKAN